MSAAEPPAARHAAMTWAQRLKRVFKIAIETCETCGGKMRVIAAIEDPGVLKRMLAPLDNRQGAGSDGIRLRVHPHARTQGLTRPRHSAARAAFDWRRLRAVQIRPMPRTFSRLGQAAQRIFIFTPPQRSIQTPRQPLPQSTMLFLFSMRAGVSS